VFDCTSASRSICTPVTAAEVVIVVLALLAGSLVKSVTGMGLPVFAIPIMALFVPVEDAIVVIAAPTAALNGWLCWRVRYHRHETRDLGRLAVAGILGAVLGALLLAALPERVVLAALAAMILVYVIRFFASPDVRVSEASSARWSPAVGFGAGVSLGGTGVSGPILATWLFAYRLKPDAYIFSITLLFSISGLAQLAVFAVDGRLLERIGAVAITFIPVFAMVPFGTVLRRRLSGQGFERAVLAVLTLSSMTLLVRALR
jgi:uncharacterized protein